MASADMDIKVPSTPPPDRPPSTQSDNMNKSSLASPPPMSASMTPPPSSQPVRALSPVARSIMGQTDPFLASPPMAIKFNPSASLPTSTAIDNASIDYLRKMATDLVAAVTDARTSAAHFKLQYSLLAMETQEATQRAEVEHQMTRREVEVLQVAEQRHRAALSATPRNSLPPAQPQIDTLTKTCQDLEDERDEYAHRLQRAKKLIELEKDKSELLMEENLLLKRRIRENREHFTRLKSQSPIYATPRDPYTTPRRAPPRFPQNSSNHQPFAALLAADQVLSGESISVPSTPTRSQVAEVKHGHTRGAHSMSSLHTTPVRTRPVTADGFPDARFPLSAPGSQLVNESAERERRDRDSTISISDVEDAASDDDIPQSQASSLATDMLRKNPASQESLRLSQGAERSSSLLQTKLFGNVKKPGIEHQRPAKRRGSYGDADMKAKKAKLREGVGLGIDSWTRV